MLHLKMLAKHLITSVDDFDLFFFSNKNLNLKKM